MDALSTERLSISLLYDSKSQLSNSMKSRMMSKCALISDISDRRMTVMSTGIMSYILLSSKSHQHYRASCHSLRISKSLIRCNRSGNASFSHEDY